MEYASLEQRMAGAYLAMLPEFVPDEQAEVSADDQKAFYDLIKSLYRLLFDDPSLLVPALHEDDAFPSRYKTGYGKPELQTNVSKYKKATENLLTNMFLMGQGSAVKLNSRQSKILALLGAEDVTRLPAAWTWMSRRPEANQTAFAYCLFNREYVYARGVYARLLGEKAFRRLEEWMISQGYQAYDIYNTAWVDYRLTLTYANPAWGTERPGGGFEYKIRHTGISAQYDAYVRDPASMGVCIPYGLKRFLEEFDSMSGDVKDFVVQHTKRCDGCGYCVQTDKTGKRPPACIPVAYEQTDYKLCPYFPGYTFCWSSVDEPLADQIIAFLAFMDGYAKDKRKQAK